MEHLVQPAASEADPTALIHNKSICDDYAAVFIVLRADGNGKCASLFNFSGKRRFRCVRADPADQRVPIVTGVEIANAFSRENTLLDFLKPLLRLGVERGASFVGFTSE